MIPGVEVHEMNEDSFPFVCAFIKRTFANGMSNDLRAALWPVMHLGVEPWIHRCEVRVLVSPGDPDVYHGFSVSHDGIRMLTVIKPRYHAMADDLTSMLDGS